MEKKKMLPLAAVATEERKGGWGRSIRGAKATAKKLAKKAATQKWGMILTNYLELVDYAQMLQPAMLQSVDRNRLHVILKAMLKAQVVFPKSLHFLLVQKELEHVAPSA